MERLSFYQPQIPVVEFVTEQGMSEVLHVDAYLMRASRQKFEFDESCGVISASEPLNNSVDSLRWFSVLDDSAVRT